MASRDYWHKRTLQLENALNNRGVEYYHELEKAYTLAAKKTQQEVIVLYNKLAKNNNISLTEAKKLLTTNELKEFRWTVEEYIKYGKENAISQQWMKELENASLRYRISRLEAMKIQMQHQAECLYAQEADGMTNMLTSMYTDGYYRTAHMIQTGLGVGHSFAKLDTNLVEKVLSKPWTSDGKNFSERIWGSHRPALINDLHTGLTQSIIKGEAPDKLIDHISKRYNVAKGKAGNLVMTESAYFGNKAQQDCYAELDVEYQEFCATLDTHTSTICREMDGKVFKSNELQIGVNVPPLHCRCRSVMVPYFDDNITERAARDENGKTINIPGNMTYEEWNKKFVTGEDATDSVVDLFVPAESIRDAEQFAKDSGVEYVSFKNIDLEAANDMNKSLYEHFRDFPELKQNIHYWGSAQEKKNFLADSLRKYYEKKIGHLRTVYGDALIDKRIKSAVTSYFKTNGEWAHAFDNRVLLQDNLFSGIAINQKYGKDIATFKVGLQRSLQSKYHPVACDTIKSVFDHELGHQLDYLLGLRNNQEFLDIVRNGVNGVKIGVDSLSKYATKNNAETIAEAWAEYRNNPTPRPIAKKIGELIEKEYERKFGK